MKNCFFARFVKKNTALTCALSALVLAVAAVTAPTAYAKYSTSFSDSDSARVAKFDISMSINSVGQGSISETLIIEDVYPGWEETYTVNIANNSEVAVNYSVSPSLLYQLPLSFSVNGSPAGSLDIGGSATVELTVRWDDTEDSAKAKEYADEIDAVTVTLVCEQKN